MTRRVARLRRVLRQRRLDGMLVSGAANLRYLCGFTGSNGLLLVTRSDATFFTDFRYEEQVKTEVKGFRREILARDLYASLPASRVSGLRRIGVEADNLTLSRFTLLKKGLKKTRLVPVPDIVKELRRTKSQTEVRSIARAQHETDRAFRAILGMIEPGVTERDLALEIEWRFRQHGDIAFPSIVASGPNSAKPHAGCSDRRLRTGDAITFDIGCRINGYCSDMTRTVFLGDPGEELRQIYEAVHAAQYHALAMIKPGAKCRDVDAAARDYIADLGYGHYFRHSTGHGVGLEVHELPGLATTSRDRLRPGDVVTVEPGIYVPGLGGVRIEDMVLVTRNGCRNLTKSAKKMIIL